MPSINDKITRDNRRTQAEARAAAHDPAKQVAVLDARLGKGKGAKRERAKLAS